MISDGSRPWTPEDEDLLRQFAAEGLLVPVIAIRMNRSQEAVHLRAQRLGITLKSGPSRRDAPMTRDD